ncbi:hypothetical protein MHM39_09345 [Phaeobacter sp. CNT1-3]|nr:hypothetical protein [Phaeobacter sp. CNT1-3]
MARKPHKYTTNIPFARKQLLEIAHRLEHQGIDEIPDEIRSIVSKSMIRRPTLRRAPPTRRKVDAKTRKKVIKLMKTTKMTQEDIAQQFNIDGGRVSEIWASVRN